MVGGWSWLDFLVALAVAVVTREAASWLLTS